MSATNKESKSSQDIATWTQNVTQKMSHMDARYLRNPDLFARMAAPILASEPVRGPDGKWRWGGLAAQPRIERATASKAEPRRGSIVFHRRFSGVSMDPAARESLRMNRAKVEHMKTERQIMLKIAAVHQLQQERRSMEIENALSHMREEHDFRAAEEARIAAEVAVQEKLAIQLAKKQQQKYGYTKGMIPPDAFRKLTKKFRKKSIHTPTFHLTTAKWNVEEAHPSNQRIYGEEYNQVQPPRTFHGRTSSDFSDVNAALNRINRGTSSRTSNKNDRHVENVFSSR